MLHGCMKQNAFFFKIFLFIKNYFINSLYKSFPAIHGEFAPLYTGPICDGDWTMFMFKLMNSCSMNMNSSL
jgi:hypothetical protein